MPPRAVPLAYAGRKLTGPPEGYNSKKELQVKKWLTSTAQSDTVSDALPSVASQSEVGGPLEPALDDLYTGLRDSTDGTLRPAADTQPAGAPLSKPPKQQPRPVSDIVAAPDTRTPRVATSQDVLGATAGYVSRSLDSPTSPQLSVSAAGSPARPTHSDTGRTADTVPRATQPSTRSTVAPAGSVLSDSLSLKSASAPTARPSADVAAPFLPLYDLVCVEPEPSRALPRAALDSGVDANGVRQSVTTGASLLLARAEAAAAAAGRVVTGEEKATAALLMALKEKARLAEEMRGELAAARAAANASVTEAAQKAAAAAADAAAAAQRAAAAEAELAQARSQIARATQEAKVRRMEVEDREEEHQQEVSRLKSDVAAALAKLSAQGDSREQALREAQEELSSARQVAAGIDRQYKHLRRQYDLDKSRLDMEVARLQTELKAMHTDMAALRSEHQRTLQSLQEEAAARIAAEMSEKKAIKAAQEQAGLAKAVSETRRQATELQQAEHIAAARFHAFRDPAGALMGGTGGMDPHSCDTKRPISAPSGTGTSKHHHTAAGASSLSPATQRMSPQRTTAGSAGVGTSGTGGGVNALTREGLRDPRRQQLEQEYDEVELSRADAHRTLNKAQGALKAKLGDAQRQQKRAMLAAQLADNKIATQALSSAPEQLRAAGLAFRVSLVGCPADFASPSAPGPSLATALTGAGYRTLVDPLLTTPQPPPLPALPGQRPHLSAPLVAVSGVLVLLASPLLLASPPHAAALNTAADRGMPVLLVCPVSITSVTQITGTASSNAHSDTAASQTAAASQSPAAKGPRGNIADKAPAFDADNEPLLTDKARQVLEAAWAARIALGGGGDGTGGGGGGVSARVRELSERIGMPDCELLGVPLETLRRMSEDRSLTHPDLLTLSCPRISHLRVTLAGQEPSATPAPGTATTATGQSATTAQSGSGGAGVSLLSLLTVVRRNRHLTALTLKGPGVTVSAVRAVVEAIANTPECCIAALSVGDMELPVGGLLGKPSGIPPLTGLDLAQAGDAFTPAAAAALTALLSAPTAAAKTHLTHVSLPTSLSNAFNTPQGQEVVHQLASTLCQLSAANGGSLRTMNGCKVPGVKADTDTATSSTATTTAATAAGSSAQQASTQPHAVSDLDLSTGDALGPVIGSALLQCAVKGGVLGPQLSVLNMTGCRLGAAGVSPLGGGVGVGEGQQGKAVAIPSLAQVKVVCLADNCLGAQGVDTVCKALSGSVSGQQGSGSALAVLDLSVNTLMDAGAKALAQHLPKLTSLEVLCLGSNFIQAEGARSLASALPSLTCLRELALPGNTIGDVGAAAVAQACARLSNLAALRLQDNHNIGPEGARALGSLLASTSSLRELCMSANHLGVEGARHIAQGLSGNTSLTSLELNRCKLHADGIKHLSGALATNKTLMRLGLARNGVGDLGVKSLVESLQRNTCLTSLDLRHNQLGLVACRLLGTLLREHNTTLRTLHLATDSQHVDSEEDRPVFVALQQLAASARTLATQRRLPPAAPTPSSHSPAPASPAHTPSHTQDTATAASPLRGPRTSSGSQVAAGALKPPQSPAHTAKTQQSQPPQPPQPQQSHSGQGQETTQASTRGSQPGTPTRQHAAGVSQGTGVQGAGAPQGDEESLAALCARYRSKPGDSSAQGTREGSGTRPIHYGYTS